MKTSLQIGIVLSVTALLLYACGNKTADSKPETATKTTTDVQIPEKDPGRGIDESFLIEQAAKRQELQEMIRAFWNDKKGDHKKIRKLILNRKGEILANKRNISKSLLFSNTEKDSLIKPLDTESMNLSRELIAFSE